MAINRLEIEYGLRHWIAQLFWSDAKGYISLHCWTLLELKFKHLLIFIKRTLVLQFFYYDDYIFMWMNEAWQCKVCQSM